MTSELTFVTREEEMLRASREQIVDNNTYENIPVPCCKIDEAGFIRECNDLFAFVLGYESHELIEMSVHDLISNGTRDIVHKLASETKGNLGVFSQHIWLRKKDGSTFPAIVNIKLVMDEANRLRYGNIVVIDDTFNYRTIEGIAKDKEELKKKERLKNEFVAIASHELRTPIQPILGFALLAKRGTITQEVAWEGVLAEARRLQQLANDILDVSRIESDNLKYEFSKVKVNELISHAVNSLSMESGKTLEITFDHKPSEEDLVIDADRSRITQVITNVVGNAIKFTQQGSVRIESEVQGGFIEIRVSDTGGGIPADLLPKLFEKFATKDHGGGEKKGSGLGLYISKAIVAAHNGTITAHNNEQGGATFVIRLPLSNGEKK